MGHELTLEYIVDLEKGRRSEWSYYFETDSFDYTDAFEGYEIKVSKTLGSYQGDILYIIQDDDRFGFVGVGYGSCSGCDALQACNTAEDVLSLFNRIRSDIHWEDNALSLYEWLQDREHNLQWYGYYETELEQFLKEANDFLLNGE